MRNFTNTPTHIDQKEILEFKKHENVRSNTLAYKTFDHFYDRNKSVLNSYTVEDTSKVNPTPKSNLRDQSDSKNKIYKFNSSIDSYDRSSQQKC